jgi:hypothetical protein
LNSQIPMIISKQFKQFAITIAALAVSSTAVNAATTVGAGMQYAGIEFYGSSQITRLELEKYLGLKPGASLQQVDRAVERLNQRLNERHLSSTVQIISAPPNKIFIAVDVSDSSTDGGAATRRLKFPHHVQLRSEKPLLLLDQIEARLEKLNATGRPWKEEMRDGIKYYSDEPCNQLVDQMLKLVPDMRDELLAVVNSDPDPNRRRRAVELLQWAGNTPETTHKLMPGLDDADPEVRAACARFIFSRMEYLPDNFPYPQLAEAFSRELTRPSHQDRSKALYCLLAIAGQHPDLIPAIREFNEERVKKLADTSVIPTIHDPAVKLLAVFQKAPEIVEAQRRQLQQQQQQQQSGFDF